MAFRLKKVRYLNSERHILLQNENGPCPLLAAANALLLRGSIVLPPESVRNMVASLDDVCNVLAEQACQVSTNSGAKSDGSDDDCRDFHLNELLTIFPTLQDGLDVNPKFTNGVTGVEYTKNLTAFEMLGIELVHGWLLDPQDVDMIELIRNKTYNELIEVLIRGKEASTQLETLETEISKLEQEKYNVMKLHQPTEAVEVTIDAATEEKKPHSGEDWIIMESSGSVTVEPTMQPQIEESVEIVVDRPSNGGVIPPTCDEKKELDSTSSTDSSSILGSVSAATAPTPSTPQDLAEIEQALLEKRDRRSKLSQEATTGTLIESFLETTSHQLTHYGLMELYNHVREDALCVFFRNNHFCTLTKHEAVLYLLVTDLGYATVPEIMWEKLDAINGDTEYMTPGFIKSSLQSDLLPPSSTQSPQDMLANRNQAEYDFQLALRLSERAISRTPSQLEAEERKLIEEATKASLAVHDGGVHSSAVGGTMVEIPQEGNSTQSQEDSEMLIAMQFQAVDDASLALARQLQQEEYEHQERARAPHINRTATNNNRKPVKPSGGKSKNTCVIS